MQKAKAVAKVAAAGPHKLTPCVFSKFYYFSVSNYLYSAEKVLKESGISVAPPKHGQAAIAPVVLLPKPVSTHQHHSNPVASQSSDQYSDMEPENKGKGKGKAKAQKIICKSDDEDDEKVKSDKEDSNKGRERTVPETEGSVTPTRETSETEGA